MSGCSNLRQIMSDRSQTTISKSISPVLRPENANIRLRISAGSGMCETSAIDRTTGTTFTMSSAEQASNKPAAIPTRSQPYSKLNVTATTYTTALTRAPRVLWIELSAAVFACEGTNVTMLGTMLNTRRAEQRRYLGSTSISTAIIAVAANADAIAVCARRL